MKTLLKVLICSLFVSAVLSAKIWRVDSNTGNFAHFRTLQAANDSSFVVNDDTLYVAGSAIGYGNVTFTKRLVVIGPGYFLAENPNTQASPYYTANAGNVTFQATTSNGFLMMGMRAAAAFINGSNITLRRNWFTDAPNIGYRSGYGDVYSSVFIGYNNAVSNITLSQNHMWGFDLSNASNTNIKISNNLLFGFISAVGEAGAIITQNVINFGNQNFRVSVICYNSVVDNNILYFGGIEGTGNTYQYNIDSDQGGGTAFPAGNGNQQNVAMATVFELTGSSDAKWKLKALSPALGAGSNAYDIGAFGGPNPYVLSGLPPIPAIYNVTAPTLGTGTQGLQVQIKTKSHN